MYPTDFNAEVDEDLRLRILRKSDTKVLFRLVDSNRLHLREWLPWLDASTAPESTGQFIQGVLRQHAQKQGFSCAIVYRGRMVGIVGYHPIRWSNRSVDLGYWLSRDSVGHGIMTRCCRVLVDYAFAQLELNRVAIPTAVGNRRSRAVAERLGFELEGIMRDAEWLYDHFVDHALYAMLKRDWSGEHARGGHTASTRRSP